MHLHAAAETAKPKGKARTINGWAYATILPARKGSVLRNSISPPDFRDWFVQKNNIDCWCCDRDAAQNLQRWPNLTNASVNTIPEITQSTRYTRT